MRRIFTFWRLFALAVLGLAIYAAASTDAVREARGAPHVARFDVAGLITADPARDALLRELAEDEAVAAVMIRIDSPGGTVAGSEALYEAIRTIAEVKPVVAQMEEVAASGGYIAAIAADHIVARGNTLTGSIGVVKQEVDARGLLDSLGVAISERRSDVFKARPSPFSETPPEVAAWEEELLDDAYQWFRALVAERRGLEGPALEDASNGRAFSGRQALARGLVDEIGGPEAALEWLSANGVARGLPVRQAEVERERGSLLGRFLGLDPSELRRASAQFDRLTSGPRFYSILQ
ncbi:signal peptide peptidase SppA [Albimonas pacifica]|uniref:Signal peptide peptidase A. Serine peptidase. MEROPS family S49 n=1 Tax=Albimonas pacifica TaxID=1114924 RepID=A0A1I3MF91_9RHOB|nr:signal peptide peptidase SppA [Albimonas pacifica]SFI95601.1 signal peptide peptidase A. Serine peptidase. MEROPS family S49 [Albimonas pacifica]